MNTATFAEFVDAESFCVFGISVGEGVPSQLVEQKLKGLAE